jgi:hypothetical protein
MKIWKRKRKFAKQKRKQNFFDESGNGNGTGIDAKTEVSVSD